MTCKKRGKEGTTGDKVPSELCKHWYAEKKECTRMTNILQKHGVIGFHACMGDQKRSCEGVLMGCYFLTKE